MKKEERKRKKSYPDRCEEGRKKKERKKYLKNEERKKKRKDEYVGKGVYVGSFKRNFFLGVTYSRILKKQKRSNRLAIAAFLKSAAIGPPKRKCTQEASEFLVVLKNAAIGCHFKIYTLDLWPRFSKMWL